MNLTKRQEWFVFSIFLPDYQHSSSNNKIGEWLLGNVKEQPGSDYEIDCWFKEWIEQREKLEEVATEFLKGRTTSFKGIKSKHDFYLAVWKEALKRRKEKKINCIDCFCHLLDKFFKDKMNNLVKKCKKKNNKKFSKPGNVLRREALNKNANGEL